MIMYDYKLASIPWIIGVMRARLADNTLMESRRISTLSTRPAITSKTTSCYVLSLHLLDERNVATLKPVRSSIPGSISKRNESFLEEMNSIASIRDLNSIRLCAHDLFTKGTVCFPSVFGKLRRNTRN